MVRFAFFIFLLSSSVCAEVVSFNDLARSASKNSGLLLMRQIDIQVEAANADVVRSGYYPAISVGVYGDYNRDYDESYSGTETVGDSLISSGTRYQSSASLTMNYELFHFGTTDKQLEIAEQEVALKRLAWCDAEQALHLELLEHYHAARKSDAELQNRREMQALQEQVYDQLQRLYRAGKASRIEVGSGAMELVELQHRITSLKQTFDDAVLMLARLSYRSLDPEKIRLQPLIGMSGDDAPVPFNATAKGQMLMEQMAQKENEINMLVRSQLPAVSLYSSYYLYGSDRRSYGDALIDIGRNSWKAGFGIRMNLFEGFRYNRERQRLELEWHRLATELEHERREYAFETRRGQNRLAYMETLTEHDAKMVEHTDAVQEMTERLRRTEQIDDVSVLKRRIERYERNLTVQIDAIDKAFQKALQTIQHRGTDRCSLR